MGNERELYGRRSSFRIDHGELRLDWRAIFVRNIRVHERSFAAYGNTMAATDATRIFPRNYIGIPGVLPELDYSGEALSHTDTIFITLTFINY